MRRRVLFVTGTRAEFGLMEHALRRLRDHPKLSLKLAVTGMHLSRAHGHSIDDVRRRGWVVDAVVPWRGGRGEAVGAAVCELTRVQERLRPDVVLVCGDRVEAFAAATAGHLDGRVVAHVHGGDRALGQVDDALRHAITKLAHVHFPATAASGRRLLRLGEDRFRVHVVGTPGLDDLPAVTIERGPSAVVLLHPDSPDNDRQAEQATMLFDAVRAAGVGRGVIVYPNNDPGWQGIAGAWRRVRSADWTVHRNLPRDEFLRLLAAAGVLVGNSSSGIIEAAGLGTRVINVGDRQRGRERSANVVDVPWDAGRLARTIASVWKAGRPTPFRGRNVYGGGDAGRRIADVLAGTDLNERLRHKLIAY